MSTTMKTGRAPYFVKHPGLEEFEKAFTRVKTAAANLREAKEQVGIAKGTLPAFFQQRCGKQNPVSNQIPDDCTSESDMLKATQRYASYEVKRAVFCVIIKQLQVQQRLLREFLHTNCATLLQQLKLDPDKTIFKFNVVNTAQLLKETEDYALMCASYNETLPIFPDAITLETNSILKLVKKSRGLVKPTLGLREIAAINALLKQMEATKYGFANRVDMYSLDFGESFE